jgi:hypothetical protein
MHSTHSTLERTLVETAKVATLHQLTNVHARIELENVALSMRQMRLTLNLDWMFSFHKPLKASHKPRICWNARHPSTSPNSKLKTDTNLT